MIKNRDEQNYGAYITTTYLIKCDKTYYGVIITGNQEYTKGTYYAYSTFKLKENRKAKWAWEEFEDILYDFPERYKPKPMPKNIDEDNAKTAVAVLLYDLMKSKK
jgi:hypothetical protein